MNHTRQMYESKLTDAQKDEFWDAFYRAMLSRGGGQLSARREKPPFICAAEKIFAEAGVEFPEYC